MHLLGAAVSCQGDWRGLQTAVTDTVWNYWSDKDNVLRWLYVLAELGEAPVGQAGFQSRYPRIKDRNVSRLVSHHSGYVSKVRLAN